MKWVLLMRISTKFDLPLIFILIVDKLIAATKEDCFSIHLRLVTYPVTKSYFEFFPVFWIT